MLSGCPDLGAYDVEDFSKVTAENFSDAYEDYFDSWGNVKLYDEDVSSTSVSIEDSLFTFDTVDKLDWGEDDTRIDSDNYMLMAIKAKKDMTLDSIALYVKAKGNDEESNYVTLTIGMVVQNAIFSNIPKLFDEFDSEKDYGLPKLVDTLSQTKCSLNYNQWDSFTIDYFNKEDTYEIHEGDYIIFIFYNNTMYGLMENPKLETVEFQMLNLMIRVI